MSIRLPPSARGDTFSSFLWCCWRSLATAWYGVARYGELVGLVWCGWCLWFSRAELKSAFHWRRRGWPPDIPPWRPSPRQMFVNNIVVNTYNLSQASFNSSQGGVPSLSLNVGYTFGFETSIQSFKTWELLKRLSRVLRIIILNTFVNAI